MYIFSYIFNLITIIRNKLFDYKIFKSKTYKIPIICIGNLAVGGTGKTPHTDYIISILKNKFKIAVLSRGYGRSSKKMNYVNVGDRVEKVGDEPLMLKKKHSNVIILVERDRNKGVKKIINDYPDIDLILLDDGFQNRWINAGLNILLTTYENPYYNDFLLPYGKLRENITGVKRADILIVTKSPKKINTNEKKYMIKRLNIVPKQKLFFSELNYLKLKPAFFSKNLDSIENYHVILLTSIANPFLLFKEVLKRTKNITHLKYKDHHNFNDYDIKEIIKKYYKNKNVKKVILTTEKDIVKLSKYKDKFKGINMYVLPIKIKFENIMFNKTIINYVAANSRNN